MSEEPIYRPHPEPVVLDIGGTNGALVVYGDKELIDVPIELSPAADDDAKVHQHVLERPMPEHVSYAAVFDRIAEGVYTLWLHGEARAREVTITGGAVTEVDWTAVPAPSPTA